MAKGDNQANILSIKKGIRVFEVLCNAKQDIGVTELSRMFQINKTTIFRILNTYAEMGLVEQDPVSEKYRVTMKILALGNTVMNRLEVRGLANQYLRDLAAETNESVHLSILDDKELVIIDKMESSDSAGVRFHIGRRSPAYCTGIGKMLLSHLSQEDVAKYLDTIELIQHTPSTITSPEILMKELFRIRLDGFALDRQEHNVGISCVAAPLMDFANTVVGAISVTGPSFRVETNFDELTKKVVRTAEKISQRLGYASSLEKQTR